MSCNYGYKENVENVFFFYNVRVFSSDEFNFDVNFGRL